MLTWVVGIGGGLVALIAIGALAWYNLRKYFAAESNAAGEKALREATEKQAAELEAQRTAAEAADRERVRVEGSKVVSSGSGKSGFDFLRNSFPAKDRNGPS